MRAADRQGLIAECGREKGSQKTHDTNLFMTTTAQILDAKVKQLAKTLLHTEGLVLTTLMEMSRVRVFAELNYSGVFDYCLRALGMSKEQSYYFKKVAAVSVQVPELKTAIVHGELSLSSARRIAPILNAANQAEWITKAKELKQSELEKAVSEVNPQAHPRERIKPVAKNVSELRVVIDDVTDGNLTMLKDLLSSKLRRPATLAEVIAWAVQETRERHDPEAKAKRARRVSPGKPEKQNLLGANPAINAVTTAGVIEAAPRQRESNRLPIPAAIRHAVVQRQGAQCSFVSQDYRRCEQKRWLDLHHRLAVAHGGMNQIENLVFLCHRHHRALHGANHSPS